MFTKEDYLNLAAVVSLARVEGLPQAMWLVMTHDKLIKAANADQTVVAVDDAVTLTEE